MQPTPFLPPSQIWQLLGKYKMKHRDPKLFYLTMDINIKRTGIPLRRSLSLDDAARPVELQACHPWGECKFSLQGREEKERQEEAAGALDVLA